MSAMKIEFLSLKKVNKKRVEFLSAKYIVLLMHNGQILGDEWLRAWQGDSLLYYVSTPRPDSLEHRYLSEWAEQALHEVEKYTGNRCKWTQLNDDNQQNYPRLKSSTCLYLHSNPFEIDSPIHRGNDGKTIPIYLLPLSPIDKELLYWWRLEHNNYYSTWVHSMGLKRQASRQLCEPQSKHCKEGRDLCQTIEKATGIPAYYYLESRREEKAGAIGECCPSCGKLWLHNQSDHRLNKFWNFKLKCDDCRLVSNISDDGR